MSPATIIIVEDDSGTRRTLCGILEDAGYQVIDAENAADALETIRKSSCDLVITDIRLPDASGMEVLRQVREITPDVVVIIMTGYASVETAVAAVEHGAYAYFIKPVNPDELTINIANALKQQRLIRENKRLLDNLQSTNKKLLKAAKELRKEVTKHRRTEQALADEVTRRRILIEQSSDGIVVLEQDGKVYESNQKFAEMLGYSSDEITKLHVWDWEVNFTRKKLLNMLRSVDETGDHFETQHRCKDGTIYDVEISTNGAICAGQKLIFCVCRDVTERRQAEKALRRSEQRYRSLVNNVQLGIIRSTPGPPGRILEVNPAMEKITGYSRDELLAMDMEELYVHLEERQVFMEELASAIGTVPRELRWRKKDGSEIVVLDTVITVRDDAGQVLHFDAIIEDITERKRAEEALRESEARLAEAQSIAHIGSWAWDTLKNEICY